MITNPNLNRILASIALLFFIFTVAFGPVHLIYASAHHDVEFRCPFMFGDSVVCGTDSVAHVASWRIFLGYVGELVSILLLLIILIIWRKVDRYTREVFDYSLVQVVDKYKNIYSSGIVSNRAP